MYISAALSDTQGALMYTQRARNLPFFYIGALLDGAGEEYLSIF